MLTARYAHPLAPRVGTPLFVGAALDPDLSETTDSFETWLLHRVAEAVEGNEISADLLAGCGKTRSDKAQVLPGAADASGQ